MKEARFQAYEPETIKALLQSGASQTVCAWKALPDRLCVHGRPCQLQMEEQQVGGQQKNGQQYRLFGPIVWLVHYHHSTQGSPAITQPSTS